MMLVLWFIFALVGIINTQSYGGFRPRRSYPHQTMMMGGFYRQPSYFPQGAMTAFSSGDTAMSNTFSGGFPSYIPSDEHSNGNSFVQQKPEIAEATQDEANVQEEEAEEEHLLTTTVKPRKVPKRKQRPVKKPQEDEEEDDDEGSWPLARGGVPSYNTFFPIMFGGGGRGGSNMRSGEYDGGYPGAATAIANSFSTGKGGVASSHATAYGDPYLSTLLRNGGGGAFKRKSPSKNQD